MIEVGIYIQYSIAIFSIVLPLLIGVISRLDDKYENDSIIILFMQEKVLRHLALGVLCSIIFIIIYSFHLPPIWNLENKLMNYFLGNSAVILVFLSTLYLITVFIITYYRVYIFYVPREFYKYITKPKEQEVTKVSIPRLFSAIPNYPFKKDEQHKSIINFINAAKIFIYFKAYNFFTRISKCIKPKPKDELVLSIKTEILIDLISKPRLTNYYSNFIMAIGDSFASQRNSRILEGREIDYPKIYYDVVLRLSDVLNSNRVKDISKKYENFPALWLLGNMRKGKLGISVYANIWLVLSENIEKDSFDLFMNYWGYADQVAEYMLPLNTDGSVESNEYNEFREEQLRFIRFHYSIGALILYNHKYNLINRIFKFTRSQPPQQILLPNNMTEIFRVYDLVRSENPWYRNEEIIYFKFPNSEGIGSEGTAKRAISKYLALLFLRQFTIQSYYYGYEPLALPIFPQEAPNSKRWVEGLDFFKFRVEENLNDEALLSAIGYERLAELNRTSREYIDNLKSRLEDHLQTTIITEELSPAKIKQFKDRSAEILAGTLDRMASTLGDVKNAEQDSLTREITGITLKFAKDAFVENSMIDQTDFDTFLARTLSNNIEAEIQESFNLNTSERYLIKDDDLKESISNLSLTKNQVIVSFGHDLKYYLLKTNTTEIEDKFSHIKTHKLQSHSNREKGLYVLNKTDLPFLEAEDMSDEFNTDHKPEEINQKYHIYADIKPSEKSYNDELSVDASIFLKLSLTWKKDIKMVFIKIRKSYDNSGIPNSPSDIPHFTPKEK